MFLEKSYTKCCEETSPRLLLKIKIGHISRSTVWNVVRYTFIVCASQRLLKHIRTKVLPSSFKFLKSFFKKEKKGLELASLPHFLHEFSRNTFLTLYYINWPNFIFWFPLLLEILVNMCIEVICCLVYDVLSSRFST